MIQKLRKHVGRLEAGTVRRVLVLRKSKGAAKPIVAAAALILAMTVHATSLRILIEEQRAKIEPAVKKFQQNAAAAPTTKRAKRSATRW
jgi:hypothetical protein